MKQAAILKRRLHFFLQLHLADDRTVDIYKSSLVSAAKTHFPSHVEAVGRWTEGPCKVL